MQRARAADCHNVMIFDVIIVGSGMNSLVATAMLARKRKRVLILERNDRFGGCIFAPAR